MGRCYKNKIFNRNIKHMLSDMAFCRLQKNGDKHGKKNNGYCKEKQA